MKCLFLYPTMQMMMIIPSSITTLSAYLKKRGIQTDLFETTLYKQDELSSDEKRAMVCQVKSTKLSDVGINYKTTDMIQDFQQKINDFKPDVIAISCNDFTHVIAKKLIEYAIIPVDTRIIMGGIYSTFFPEHAIKHPRINAICQGEGWEALYEYVLDPYRTDIKNLWIKKNGQIIKNPLREPIDISDIPPEDFELFGEQRLYRPMGGKILKIIPFYIDIGCPNSCSYCTAPSIRKMYKNEGYNYLRVKPVEQIITELKAHVEKYKPEYLYCSTENFFSRPKEHIVELANQYSKYIHLPFWAEARIENITEKNVQILKQMGCNRFSVGLESGNEDYRMNVLNKRFTNRDVYNALSILNHYRINTTINNMINFPDETREMIFDTINVNRKVVQSFKDIDISLTCSTFVPCGGSSLQNYCIEKGYFNLEEYLKNPPTTFHGGFFIKNSNLSETELRGIYRTFPLYVRLPLSLYSQIKKVEKISPETDQLFDTLRNLYWKIIDTR